VEHVSSRSGHRTAISESLGETGETAELTIYRIIQEALTNIFRHAGATRVKIVVEPAPSGRSGAAATESQASIVSVRDNGAGLPADHKQGFGLIGMRERVLALGGTMTVVSTDQGVTVEALVPSGTRQLQAAEPL
jgi:two-component system sensor histidine kinase UhpB